MTPGMLGGVTLVAALIFSLLGLTLAVLAHLLRDARYLEAAKRLSGLALLSALVSYGSLQWAILINDFSVSFVAQSSSAANPLWVKLVTPWSALEGSILLWASIQAFYGWIVTLRVGKSLDVWRAPAVLGTLFAVQVFFFAVILFASNPFGIVFNPPLDGQGTNPLLQNHWMMAVHPVLMYLGFVGLSVPFAYAVSAMINKHYQSWVHETRWWTVVTWGFLTAGVWSGMWWSYEILGWGGYWAWDPVENASLIPWLFATAFLHTAQVQQRKGLFKTWNFALITLAFVGTLFGTFLTRSGIIMSVHAFAQGPVGPWFLVFLLLMLALGLSLLARVSSEIREAGEVQWKSREGALLGGALLFTTFSFVVLIGTLWPLVVEAISGAEVSIGAPFFDQISIPFAITMLLLMGIGPLLPWRNPGAQVVRNLVIMLATLVSGTVLFLLAGFTLGVSFTVGLFAYNVAAIWLMVSQGVRERSRSLGISAGQAFVQLFATNRRRFGSHIVHFGIALAALSIAFSMTYRVVEQRTLNVGDTWNVHGMEIRLLSIGGRQESNRFVALAPIEVRSTNRHGWGSDGRFETRLNFFPQMAAPLATPVVRYSLYNDFYFVLMQFDSENRQWATLKVIVTPMVLWLWVAGFIVVFGTLYSLWPVGSRVRVSRREATPVAGG